MEKLSPKDADLVRAFLAKEPGPNLYLLGLFEEFGLAPREDYEHAFYGRFDGRDLKAVLFVGSGGGLVVPSSNDSRACGQLAEELASTVKPQSIVGDKGSVDATLRAYPSAKVRCNRTSRLFAVSADDLGPFTNPTLRLATEADLERLLPLAAGWVKETFDRDPSDEDPLGFRARVLHRVRMKRTYVLDVDGKLVFKIDVGSRSQYGAELEGLYTAPDERRKRHATLSLGQISRHLLSSLPRLTIRVDDRDPALAEVARKVGYIAGRAQRLAVME